MSGRQFTWANNRPVPTYEKLDRVLMSTDWEPKHPMVSVRSLERIEKLSDHAPLLLDSGSEMLQGKQPQFKFELGWLYRVGFSDMVKEVWNRPVRGNTPIKRWNNKIRALRKHLRGWARHLAGLYKKEKRRLSEIIDHLEAIAEMRLLSEQELDMKNQANEKIATLLRPNGNRKIQIYKIRFRGNKFRSRLQIHREKSTLKT